MLDEGRLHRMQGVGRAQPLDGRYFVFFVHHGKREARIDPHAVYQHRARATLAVIAALLGSGQLQVFT